MSTRPLPPPTPLGVLIPPDAKALSLRQAARVLSTSPSTLLRRLRAAPQNAQGRVIDGEYRGCYRRGVHWRMPLATLERLQAAQQRDGRPGQAGRGPLRSADAQEVFEKLKAYLDAQLPVLKREIVADIARRLGASRGSNADAGSPQLHRPTAQGGGACV